MGYYTKFTLCANSNKILSEICMLNRVVPLSYCDGVANGERMWYFHEKFDEAKLK